MLNYLVEDCILSWLSVIMSASTCIKLSILSRYAPLTYVVYTEYIHMQKYHRVITDQVVYLIGTLSVKFIDIAFP